MSGSFEGIARMSGSAFVKPRGLLPILLPLGCAGRPAHQGSLTVAVNVEQAFFETFATVLALKLY